MNELRKKELDPQIVIHNLPPATNENDVSDSLQGIVGEPPKFLSLRNYRNGNTNKFAVVVLSPFAWNSIIKRGSINVNWVNCPIKNNIPIIRCTNCCMFGHIKKFCRNERAILQDNAYVNYIRHNEFRTRDKNAKLLDAIHNTFHKECPLLLNHLENNANRTNYGCLIKQTF